MTRHAQLRHRQIGFATQPGTYSYRGGTLVELSAEVMELWAAIKFAGFVKLEQEDDRPFTWIGVSVDPERWMSR